MCDCRLPAIEQYLADSVSITRDALFCSVDAETVVLLHQAASEILMRPDLLEDLRRIDIAILGDNDAWNAAPRAKYPAKGSLAGAFLLIFPILHHLASIRKVYESRSIPEQCLRATMADVGRWVETYTEWTAGLRGFAQINWLREHISARIFQIGRLQFQPGRWTMPHTVLRNTNDGTFAIIAYSGVDVTNDGGYVNCAGAESKNAYSIEYDERADGICGHRILANGKISTVPELFRAGEWTRYIASGDPVLNVHIPSGSKLVPDECRQSVLDAVAFFKRYFPERSAAQAKIAQCGSWLLYSDFSKILPSDSNIVGFQKLFLLCPLPGAGDAQFYERVFTPHGRAVKRTDLKTSLQFALFDYIQAGHTPVCGGGVIPLF